MKNTITTTNPYNSQQLNSYRVHDPVQIESVIDRAHSYQKEWSLMDFSERGVILDRWADVLDKNKHELAELAALEMGKPLAQGIAEVDKCIKTIRFYRRSAESFLKNEDISTEATKSYVHYSPLGIVLGIMPWNFPYWQVFRAFAPIVMSGNTFILKHASQVTGCAMKLQELWSDSEELPEGLFQVLLVPGQEMEMIIAHPKVAAVTFTGSTDVGGQIASVAGRHIKKHLLELGGSDAYIILEDADIELAADKCTQSRLNNTGQSCIAAKRIIVNKNIADEFIRTLKVKFEKKQYGNPLEEQNHLGPMSRKDLRDEMHLQVSRTVHAGAELITGGFIPEGDNALYPPTIVSRVKKGMPMYDEEVFGPAVAVIIVDNDDEAIAVANDSVYGLGGGIFTKNTDYAETIASKYLHTGFIAINDFVSSDPRLAFGGVNKSGYGRELSRFGMLEFCNVKTIYVR